MTDLRTAAQQALEAMEYHVEQTRPIWKTSEAITALRAALAEPVQDGCDHCNHPLYAAVKCRVCGRVTEPAEPVAYWNEDESSLAFKPGRGAWVPLYSEPKPCPTCEALARTVMMDQTGYDTAPPQRKPLTEEEIYSICKKAREDAEAGWPYGPNYVLLTIRGVERAHGIT